MTEESLSVAKVFVPGGRPTVTYVSRREVDQEGQAVLLDEQLNDYLAERLKILSVSGPTKCGKTVLLRNHLRDAAWLSGGTISSSEEFWEAICDEYDIDLEFGMEGVVSQTENSAVTGEATMMVLKGGGIAGESVTRGRTHKHGRKVAAKNAGRRFLKENLDEVIVVDDFHYIPTDAQLSIVRQLKDLVFDGLRVIFAAVPHRAYDVVKIEREMTGRVKHISVGFWDHEDLAQIAHKGFDELNLEADKQLVDPLVREAFKSPHLMQEFCRELCKWNDVRERQCQRRSLTWPAPDAFFGKIAPNTAKVTFDLLAKGPRQRTDRIQRKMRDGTTTDIYGAVLAAVANTGPEASITYEELRASLREVLDGSVPQAHEITNVLNKMTEIARTAEGEPVVEYEGEYRTLHIADPFFSFWLRWGARAALAEAGEPAG